MGRAFEFRKERKFARWGKMAKTFTKIGRDIAMAVKANGPDPANNPKLRIAMQNARAANMPKANVESAIKKASEKGSETYDEVVYEGMGPGGVAFMIETATDNPTRTVANLRVIFNKNEGALGTQGSVEFMFERKGVFRLKSEGLNPEELELELIDHGCEDFDAGEGEVIIFTAFADFGKMQKALEDKGIEVISAQLQRFTTAPREVDEATAEKVNALIEKLEDDDDVQAVYTSMSN